MIRIPSFIEESFKRRSSLAFLIAILTVASGLSFVPVFLSFPFGETQISAALIEKEAKTNKKTTSILVTEFKRII
ncbi:hypothetical protein D3C80_1748130 [compost metagenome]